MVYLKQEDDGGAEDLRSMPELAGKTAVEVNNILNSLGLKLRAMGVGGVVVRQNPAPGTTIYSGEIVEVEFAYPQQTDGGGVD
jgi:beta-lactam-binding protein with PASTA domain